MIKIVGMGPGNPEMITLAAVNAIVGAEVIAGAPRNLEAVAELFSSLGMDGQLEERETLRLEKDLNKFLAEVKGSMTKNTVVVVSGDPGFYSLLDTFRKADISVTAVPGISSFQYFYSALGISYKEHRLLSCHGRTTDYVAALKESTGVFLLTDGEQRPEIICKNLIDHGMNDIHVYIGENLSYENEEIHQGKPGDFIGKEFSLLSVVILEREA